MLALTQASKLRTNTKDSKAKVAMVTGLRAVTGLEQGQPGEGLKEQVMVTGL